MHRCIASVETIAERISRNDSGEEKAVSFAAGGRIRIPPTNMSRQEVAAAGGPNCRREVDAEPFMIMSESSDCSVVGPHLFRRGRQAVALTVVLLHAGVASAAI